MTLPGRTLSLRLNTQYVPVYDVRGSSCSPGSIGCTAEDDDRLPGDLFLFTGDIVFRLAESHARPRPYLLAGAGFKDYSGAFDLTTVAVHFALGIDQRVGRNTALALEIGDYISRANRWGGNEDARIQHDLVATVGVRASLY
jgi:hypothetical protein